MNNLKLSEKGEKKAEPEPEPVNQKGSARPISKRTLFGVLGIAVGIIFILVVFNEPNQKR